MLKEQYLRSVSLKDASPLPSGYPFDIPAIKRLGDLEFHPKVTFLMGDNGMGKSTLMEALAVALRLNAEGGSSNFLFDTQKTHSRLHEYLSLVRGIRRPQDDFFLRAETFYNVATEVERLDVSGYGFQPLHAQSHGESFWALLTERFRGKGLYLLDEPEAALSPSRQLAALSRIHQLVKARSQFIIATHSPILMAYPDSIIYRLDEHGIGSVAFEETEHFNVTRDFLNRRDSMLHELLDDEAYQDGGS